MTQPGGGTGKGEATWRRMGGTGGEKRALERHEGRRIGGIYPYFPPFSPICCGILAETSRRAETGGYMGCAIFQVPPLPWKS